MAFQPGPYGFPKGCAWTKIPASTSAFTPTDYVGVETHSALNALWAASVMKGNKTGVNIYGLWLTATDGTARTLNFTTADSSLDDYTQNPILLTIKASADVGTYYPIGGPNGLFLPTPYGGGFACATSNAALLGLIFWEPVGS